mgnify:CR=1 FL=1
MHPQDTPNETWRPVLGWEDRYWGSSSGRVWGVKGARVLKPSFNVPTGRWFVQFWNRPKRITIPVHTVIALAFLGPRPPGFEIDHINGNRTNNRRDNLEYVTPEVNRARRNSRNSDRPPHSTLTHEDVRYLRSLRKGEIPIATLAKKYGVSRSTIFDARQGRTWKHVA